MALTVSRPHTAAPAQSARISTHRAPPTAVTTFTAAPSYPFLRLASCSVAPDLAPHVQPRSGDRCPAPAPAASRFTRPRGLVHPQRLRGTCPETLIFLCKPSRYQEPATQSVRRHSQLNVERGCCARGRGRSGLGGPHPPRPRVLMETMWGDAGAGKGKSASSYPRLTFPTLSMYKRGPRSSSNPLLTLTLTPHQVVHNEARTHEPPRRVPDLSGVRVGYWVEEVI